jgi:Fic family protein
MINDTWQWQDPELNRLLEKAALKLGELNSFSLFVPNIDLFIQLHVTKEAVVSSRIEGTQTKMDEALLPESEVAPERRDDWKDVNNYIRALNSAIAQLDTLPISGRLLKQTHAILLDGARGDHKLPGEYRRSQNWIGGLSLADAVMVPPHHELLPELMGDLELFLHNDSVHIPELVKAAIAHYQFETIHPFLDGNGRIGRLLITLYLIDRKIIAKPLLYLSAFFEKNKILYYDNLTRVRTHHDMRQWIRYFLVGVEQTAAESIEVLQKVLEIRNQAEITIREGFGRRVSSGLLLLQRILAQPIVTVEEAVQCTGLSYKAANDLVQQMQRHGLLKEITGQSRNRIFVFESYLSAFR